MLLIKRSMRIAYGADIRKIQLTSRIDVPEGSERRSPIVPTVQSFSHMVIEAIFATGWVTSQRRDLHTDPIPVWRQLESGEFEIVVRASSWPNYIQAAEIGNRILLTNGVHKACALFLRGHSRVPCLLRRVSRLEECGLGVQTSMVRHELLDGPRPAQVIDF
jgi:hypothetical protein